MQKQFSILFILLTICLLSSCQKEEIKIAKSLDGTWTIDEIIHFTDDTMITIEDTLTEPIGEITFEFCNFNREDDNCNGSITFVDGESYGLTYLVDKYFDEGFSIGVGRNPDMDENVTVDESERPFSMRVQWVIEERTEDQLTFTSEASGFSPARVKCTRK